MRVSKRQNVMKDLTVKEAMRRLIINLTAQATLEEAIRYAIKYKVNAILITDRHQEAVGVVTKPPVCHLKSLGICSGGS